MLTNDYPECRTIPPTKRQRGLSGTNEKIFEREEGSTRSRSIHRNYCEVSRAESSAQEGVACLSTVKDCKRVD